MSGPWIALEHHEDFSKQFVTVQWTFYNVCNFSCSYCLPELNSGDNKGINYVHATRFLHRLFTHNPDKKFYFEFTGGEITHFPEFRFLMEFIKSSGGHTGILSNGSKPLRWWKDHVHLLDNVSLSFHAEEGDAEAFYEVATFLNEKVNLSVSVIMKPENFSELHSFAERLAGAGIHGNLQALFKNFSGSMYPYSDEQLLILKSPSMVVKNPVRGDRKAYRASMEYISEDGSRVIANPTELIARGENSWKGWKCMAGVENIAINMKGDIYRGICRVGNKIGSILDPGFRLPDQGVVCDKPVCHCGFDIMCSKYRI